MAKIILILGASYAGLNIAHSLLKRTLNTLTDYKVVLVSPNSHHYHNIASVRAIIPDQIPDSSLFLEIAPGFNIYPVGSFSFILGTATSIDTTAKTVTISNSNCTRNHSYEILVIATGSRTKGDVPWKSSLKGYRHTRDELHKTQEAVKRARSIVVGGGGPTGVEVAAELACMGKTDLTLSYGPRQKQITLVASGLELLADSMPKNIAQSAESQLKKMGVRVVKAARIISSRPSMDGMIELLFSNGEMKLVDLYLPTTGVIPNTSFIPHGLLDPEGYVIVDDYLRVQDVENVWAAGDVTTVDWPQIIYAEKQATAVAKNLDLVLKGKEPVAYKKRSESSRMIGVSLGRNKAIGRKGNWRIPGAVIRVFKGRTLGVEKMPGVVNGSAF